VFLIGFRSTVYAYTLLSQKFYFHSVLHRKTKCILKKQSVTYILLLLGTPVIRNPVPAYNKTNSYDTKYSLLLFYLHLHIVWNLIRLLALKQMPTVNSLIENNMTNEYFLIEFCSPILFTLNQKLKVNLLIKNNMTNDYF
jgi:hypothetical protein